MKGPKFLRYVRPLLEVLRSVGGSGVTADIIDQVLAVMSVSESELEEVTASGAPKVRNQVQWARLYLVKASFIDASRRGVWSLTSKAYETPLLTDEDVHTLFQMVSRSYQSERKEKSAKNGDDDGELTLEDELHGDSLLSILKGLSAEGFEQICKRLLSEIGIHDVQVTGGSNDKGIDGTGVIKVNDVVGFNIIFQCKRYKESVGPHYVRDFRGSMQGRADKGIILTTGWFSSEAKKEAVRDGVPPIELIDGERLVSLFEKHQLGLKPKTVYDIDSSFFAHYQ